LTTAAAAETLRFDHFELHPAERGLRVRGEPVSLGGRAFDLLLVLAQRHERLVTKQELLDLVWPGLVVEEHNVATQIGNLRKLLGAGAITTLPGYGYRLTAARRDAAAAPAGSAAGQRPRHNLPDPRTRFIGREAALADLARLLASTRLLTLTGIGGCGKTRLALRFAQRQLEAFDGGVWFVDLAPLNEAGRVAAFCAGVLGIREEGDKPVVERLLDHLANRRTLLLLDNCEHLIDGVVALVEALLAGGGDTAIVATSREGLGVSGEQIYPVRSLSLPAAEDLASVLAAGTVLTRSTPLYDLPNGRIIEPAEGQPLVVPEGAVVVPGSRQINTGRAREWGLSVATPIIVKYRDEKTSARTALEAWIR